MKTFGDQTESGKLGGTSQRITNSGLNAKDFNLQLASHQQSAEWVFRDQIACLHRWLDRFNANFGLQLEMPAVAIRPLPRTRYAHYCGFKNWFGLDHEISFNLYLLPGRPKEEVLSTWLHELLHLWQYLHGKPGKPPYHNVEFQKKSEVLGLIVDGRGITEIAQAPSPFLTLLEQHDDDLADLDFGDHPVLEKQPTKLIKWQCSCKKPVNVRCAVELRATCDECGQPFKRPLKCST